jgi:tyrosyl-tRNA synthetase
MIASSRLEGEGLSFTEFAYQLLQGADFMHLYSTHGCLLQVCVWVVICIRAL